MQRRSLHYSLTRLTQSPSAAGEEIPPVILQHTTSTTPDDTGSAASSSSSASSSAYVPPPTQEPINPEEYSKQQGFTDDVDDEMDSDDQRPFQEKEKEDPERAAMKKRILSTAVGSVSHNGWTTEAFEAACSELDLPRSTISDLFPAGPVELVYFTMDDARERMTREFEKDAAFAAEKDRSAKVERVMRWRLEQNIPYMSQWSQALALCAQPQQAMKSACKMGQFIDDLAYLTGDDATDVRSKSQDENDLCFRFGCSFAAMAISSAFVSL
jgi:rpsU-divergently transcribed protein